MSLRELWTEMAAGRERARRDLERDVRLAWVTEYMAREKTLNEKSMDRLLTATRSTKQTPAQLYSFMTQLSGTIGVPLQRVPWKAKAPPDAH